MSFEGSIAVGGGSVTRVTVLGLLLLLYFFNSHSVGIAGHIFHNISSVRLVLVVR